MLPRVVNKYTRRPFDNHMSQNIFVLRICLNILKYIHRPIIIDLLNTYVYFKNSIDNNEKHVH